MKKVAMIAVVAVIFAGAGVSRAGFDNPRYAYTKILDVGEWVRTAESQFSYDETKILWSERESDPDTGVTVRRAVKYGDWDRTTKTISNIVTVAELSNPAGVGSFGHGKWSPDDSYIAYGVGTGGENAIKRYRVSDGTIDTLYAPAAGVDWRNFDFYGDNNSVVFWDYKSQTVTEADLFTYDGTTRSQLTDTEYKEYEPRVLGSDTSQVLYWSGEKPALEPYDSVHILNSDSSVTDVALGTADLELYWAVWGKDHAHAAAVGRIGGDYNGDTELLLYEKVGGSWQFAEDLTGPGYTPANGDWNFFGSFLPDGSFCFQSQVGGSGRDIWFAEVIPEPVTMGLFALGALGVLLRRRRR